MIEAAVEVATKALKEQGFNLGAVSLRLDVPATLAASLNSRSFTLALVNIIKNAYESLCHNKSHVLRPGEVAISASAGPDAVILSVADTGRGLSAEEMEWLGTFIPGHKSNAKPFSTGFGLPTAYEMIVAHDGELGIESTPGEGTTVTIRLPLEAPK